MTTNRRKATNLTPDPRALLRLSIPFITLLCIGIAVVSLIHYEVLNALNAAAEDQANAALIGGLSQLVMKVLTMASIGMVVLGVSCLAFWLIYSHRIFGPSVPFHRHIESLINGDYKSRVNLRRGDEFKDIASALNRLAEKLEADHSGTISNDKSS